MVGECCQTLPKRTPKAGDEICLPAPTRLKVRPRFTDTGSEVQSARAYAAGFGTAGSMLAGAAVLFVLASAIVAFQGWPRIASQRTPSSVQINPAPATGSRVSRRLRTVSVAGPAAVAAATGVSHAARVTPGAEHRVGFRTAGSAPAVPAPGGTTRAAGGSAHGRPIPGSGAVGKVRIAAPTHPPVRVTVPTGRVLSTAGSVIRKGTAVSSPRSPKLSPVPRH